MTRAGLIAPARSPQKRAAFLGVCRNVHSRGDQPRVGEQRISIRHRATSSVGGRRPAGHKIRALVWFRTWPTPSRLQFSATWGCDGRIGTVRSHAPIWPPSRETKTVSRLACGARTAAHVATGAGVAKHAAGVDRGACANDHQAAGGELLCGQRQPCPPGAAATPAAVTCRHLRLDSHTDEGRSSFAERPEWL
jgi:hypothetical protein